MTPDFLNNIQRLLWTVLATTVLSMGGIITWAIHTTYATSVSVPQLSEKIDDLSRQVGELKTDGERREHVMERRDTQNDELLAKHNLDISEALAEHNKEIDDKISALALAFLDGHSKDLSDLKSFVQSLRDQKQVIVVRHAEAEVPLVRATPTPPPIRAAENVLKELLGVSPKHYRAGSGRRPGQPMRTR